MKHLKHPATIIATLALFVALASGAYASGLINGSQIKNHTIATKKLTAAAVKTLESASGGKILVYNFSASAGSPSPTTIGSVLGDTFGATCTTSGGDAELTLYLKTSDGSWAVDIASVGSAGGTDDAYAGSGSFSAGTINNFTEAGNITAAAGNNASDRHIMFTQLKPQPGTMVWHEQASTKNAASCHLTIEGTPETVAAVIDAKHRPSNAAHLTLPLR
jgi:hypothetical protein